MGIRSRYSGLRVQGTAISPSSTTLYTDKILVEQMGIEPTTSRLRT